MKKLGVKLKANIEKKSLKYIFFIMAHSEHGLTIKKCHLEIYLQKRRINTFSIAITFHNNFIPGLVSKI